MKKGIVFLLVSIILLSSIVLAGFEIGDKDFDLEEIYSAKGSLIGWINISLQDEPIESIFSVRDSDFSGEINLIDFLNENDFYAGDYSCLPLNCEKGYVFSDEITDSINIVSGEGEVVGLKLEGNVRGINEIKFDIDSSAGESCIIPLEIDILDDDENIWKYDFPSSDFNCIASTGDCYQTSSDEIKLDTVLRCEKVTLKAKKSFEIGAWIRKQGNTNLKAHLYDLGNLNTPLDSCDLPDASESGGNIGCIINPNLTSFGEYYICINADSSSDYTIQYEQEGEMCGFYNIDLFSDEGEYNSDYNVFAKAAKYQGVLKFTVDESLFESIGINLEEEVYDYIYSEYDRDCTDGCVIPIKIKPGPSQTITFSDILVDYNQTIKSHETNNKIYSLDESSVELSSGFLKLDLGLINITVPEDKGKYELRLFLGGSEIIDDYIYVTESLINWVLPTSVAAAFPTEFIANVSAGRNNSIVSYSWDFGDGTETITTTNSVTHTYYDTGLYTLKLEVEDKNGRISNKIISVRVGSPKDIASQTITDFRANINNVTTQINNLPLWYKSEIEKKVSIDDLSSRLRGLETRYEIAETIEDYIGIMGNLSEMDVPYAIISGESSTGDYFPIIDINPDYLLEIALEQVTDASIYRDSIITWMMDNIDFWAESKVYNLHYDHKIEPLITKIKLKVIPKNDFERDSYLIIEEDYDNIKFKEDYGDKQIGTATGITYDSLIKNIEKITEFVLFEKVDLTEFVIYMSPEFSELPEVDVSLGACDFDEKCESGETWKNCRNDCKPWGRMIIYIIIIVVIAFAVYIFLQEWYKRRYEKHLFKNKNDLFNLISFISNALNQGLERKEVISKLKKFKWSGEQISYAFKKVKGERTGMWEIPVFMWIEKKKLKEELEKRKNNQFKTVPNQSGTNEKFFKRF